MQIADRAILVHCQHYGERDRIAYAFSRHHGLMHGLIKGARAGAKSAHAALDVGTLGDAVWQARLPEHLGSLRFESQTAFAALLMHQRARLCMAASACALIKASFALADAHPSMFDALLALLEDLRRLPTADEAACSYVAFECALLEESGFGLDLSQCAATGSTDDLCYVSPKSGRAVSRAAGAPYAEKLLPLPAFLRPLQDEAGEVMTRLSTQEIAAGLRLTGYFLSHHLREMIGRDLPQTRTQLQVLFA